MYFFIFSDVFIIIHNKNILYNLFILSLVYIGYFELIGRPYKVVQLYKIIL